MEKPVYLYDYVSAPYRLVTHLLRDQPEALFDRAADASVDRFSELVAGLGIEIAGRPIAREVVVTLGDFEQLSEPLEFCRRAVQWEAVSASSLFPRMEGSIEVQPLSPTESQLSLVGRYQPPLGALGAALDSLVLHRVAEASLHRFFSRVAARIADLGSSSTDHFPRAAPD